MRTNQDCAQQGRVRKKETPDTKTERVGNKREREMWNEREREGRG